MKNIFTILCLLTVSFTASSQQFEWVKSNSLIYDLNPSIPSNIISASEAGQVYAIHPDTSSLIFGSDLYGTTGLDCYNSSGTLQWTAYLGNQVIVTGMITDPNGNVYLSGSYMEELQINGTDSLQNTGSGFDVNLFLLSFNSQGDLLWKRNITAAHPDYYSLTALAVDHQENLWYGVSNFFDVQIFETDDLGNDLQSYELEGAKTLGGMSFDNEGNLFISGSTGTPFIEVQGSFMIVPETYMMFVTRIDAAGNTSWISMAHDVTFQSPVVKTDKWGNAYVSGSLFDATTFGDVSFLPPQWIFDVFITRVDPQGNFQWGIQAPQSGSSITGDFERGSNSFMDVDGDGNLYLTGVTRGDLDWGNGVISGGLGIPYNTFSILSFDTSGSPVWALNGGSELFNHSCALSVNASGDCYFSGSVIDEAAFGTISVNTGNDYASVFGKISSAIATGFTVINDDCTVSVNPNPADEFLNLEILCQQNIDLKIELYDISGKKISTLADKNFSAGHHIFPYRTGELTPGIYLLVMKTSGTMVKKKVVVQ